MYNTLTMKPKESSQSFTTLSSVRNRISRKTDPRIQNPFVSRSRSKNKDKALDTSFQDYCIRRLGQKTPKSIKIPNLRESLERINAGRNINDSSGGEDMPRLHNLVAEKKKRREPTPAKSKRELYKTESPKIYRDNDAQVINEATLLSLQQDLKTQEQQNKRLTSENSTIKNQSLHLKTEISKLQETNFILKMQNQKQSDKIVELQKLIEESESNLVNATNALKKLKEKIRENRLQELQMENQSLCETIKELNEKIMLLEYENAGLQDTLNQFSKEIEELRRKEKQLSESQKNIEMRQKYLLEELHRLKPQLKIDLDRDWQSQYHKLLQQKNIQIYLLETALQKEKLRKYHIDYSFEKEIEKVKQSKEIELKEIKVKFSKVIQNLKIQQEKSGESREDKIMPVFSNKRKGVIDRWTKRLQDSDSDGDITYELSPEP